MPYYVRFLKSPRVHTTNGKTYIRALVTVTTDLGESFFAEKCQLNIAVLANDQKPLSPWSMVQWQPSARIVWVESSPIPSTCLHHKVTLLVSSRQGTGADILGQDCEVLSVRYELGPSSNSEASSLVQRMFKTSSHQIKIFEEMGDSIARHVWDAAIGLILLLDGSLQGNLDTTTSSLNPSSWRSILHRADGLRVLELGTGCGIVGIFLASSVANCLCLLTDLSEAMTLLDINMCVARPAHGSSLDSGILDWAQPLSVTHAERQWDLVIVSDCTYNSDTVPDLVSTMSALAQISPDVIFLVSMKVRHESEAVFFELMESGGFLVLDHQSIPLQSWASKRDDMPAQVIEVYALHKGLGLPCTSTD